MASTAVITPVLVLDLLAFVLAVGAERRRSTAYVNVDVAGRAYCVYGTDAATWYGVGALALLLAGQAIAMAATRCFCCGRALSPGRWRAFAGVCFIISWLTFVIAELCLLAGSVRNAYHTKYSDYFINGAAALRHAAQGCLRRRCCLHLPHRALHRAPLHLLRQGPFRRCGHLSRRSWRRRRHDQRLKASTLTRSLHTACSRIKSPTTDKVEYLD